MNDGKLIRVRNKPKIMNANDIQKLQTDRLRYLENVYHESKGDPSWYINFRKIGTDLYFDERYMFTLINWLYNENYIQIVTNSSIQITNLGIQVIENAIRQPENPSGSFIVSYNSIHIDRMVNSTIRQETTNSVYNQSIPQNMLETITQLITSLEYNLKTSQIKDINLQDLCSEIETIKAQIKSSKPRKQTIVDSFNSISSILQSFQTIPTAFQNILSEIGKLVGTLNPS